MGLGPNETKPGLLGVMLRWARLWRRHGEDSGRNMDKINIPRLRRGERKEKEKKRMTCPLEERVSNVR